MLIFDNYFPRIMSVLGRKERKIKITIEIYDGLFL